MKSLIARAKRVDLRTLAIAALAVIAGYQAYAISELSDEVDAVSARVGTQDVDQLQSALEETQASLSRLKSEVDLRVADLESRVESRNQDNMAIEVHSLSRRMDDLEYQLRLLALAR